MSTTRKAGVVWVVVGALAVWPVVGQAAEHGGKEHGGTTHEHGGQTAVQPPVEPSAEALRQAIRDHIAQVEKAKGAYTIRDTATGQTRTLTLVRVHERVGKTGSLYYSCTDMRDVDNGELLDLDFDVDASGGALQVVDERIHKVEGKPRYTYDDKDNRIPLM